MNVLVIGAAGGFGGTVARELLARGHGVVALLRPGGRRAGLAGAREVLGNALHVPSLRAAARGVDAIVWGFHLPYPRWQSEALLAARATAEVAAELGLTVLFPGNVYNLGQHHVAPVAEDTPCTPCSELGRVRERIEAELAAATEHGARVILVRAGDYFGPGARNSWFETMTRGALRGGAILDLGGRGVPHAWAYLPDVARASVDLLELRHALPRFAPFHFAGHVLDTSALIAEVERALGGARRRTLRIPWWPVQLASPFSRLLRLALGVRYLWLEPVLLDGSKLARTLPEFRQTALPEAVLETLRAIAQRQRAPDPMRRVLSAASTA